MTMNEKTLNAALEATARIACCTALLGAFACKPKQAPPANVTPQPTEAASEAPAKTAAPAKADAPVSAAETPANPGPLTPRLPDNFAECKTDLDAVFARGSEVKATDKTKECCDQYAQFLDSQNMTAGDYREDCCSLLNWQGSMACTPWGPPVPPMATGLLNAKKG